MRFLKGVFSLILVACSSLASSQQRDENEVVLVGETDPEVVAAIKQARKTLPEFLKLAAAPPSNTDDYKLKVVVVDGTKTEHFWVTPFKTLPNGFAGVLANEPKVVGNVKKDQIVRFDESLVSHWGYVKDGRQVGSFTVCALFKKMPIAQVEYYRKTHGFDC
ncbi:hypothetical protein RD110_00460 [Rhodoferax koreense]|uniref:DUF2314 domain-containing protein n=1 Tax=Rhodoferax koreensis TaxID=1842727 RepID=A0A1P8JQ55_9BURK|nr:DUF2314 domain-containing protein [Rhodoferax koreense]APW35873.1 hypothetical protein RD110_00460 [Rhodoferax koreense]